MTAEKKRLLVLSTIAPATFGALCLAWARLLTMYFQHRTGRVDMGDHTIYSAVAVEWPFYLFTAGVVLAALGAGAWAVRRRWFFSATAILATDIVIWLCGLDVLVDIAFRAHS